MSPALATWQVLTSDLKVMPLDLTDSSAFGPTLAEFLTLSTLPVLPKPGLLIAPKFCSDFVKSRVLPSGTPELLRQEWLRVQAIFEARLRNPDRPFLLQLSRFTVGDAIDTQPPLCVGLTPSSVTALSRRMGSAQSVLAWFVDQCFRFARVALNPPKGSPRHKQGLELSVWEGNSRTMAKLSKSGDDLPEVFNDVASRIETFYGVPFPLDPIDQLVAAVSSLIASWNDMFEDSRSASLPLWITATPWVFGTGPGFSAGGHLYTRDTGTGDPAVAGIYRRSVLTPLSVDDHPNECGPLAVTQHYQGKDSSHLPEAPMELASPDSFASLWSARSSLESAFRHPIRCSFVIEEGHPFILPPIAELVLSGHAHLSTLVSLVDDNVISEREAVSRTDPQVTDHLRLALSQVADSTACIANGSCEVEGIASGYFEVDPARVIERASLGEDVIYGLRDQRSPMIEHALQLAKGAIMVAAEENRWTAPIRVMARDHRRLMVTLPRARLSTDTQSLHCHGHTVAAGERVSMYGRDKWGAIFRGDIEFSTAPPSPALRRLSDWELTYRSSDLPIPWEGSDSFAFVSYARNDRASIREDLVDFHRYGVRFWYDQALRAGHEYPKIIETQISLSAAFLIFLSARAMASDWVRREFELAFSLKKPILPVIIDSSSLISPYSKLKDIVHIEERLLMHRSDYLQRMLREFRSLDIVSSRLVSD